MKSWQLEEKFECELSKFKKKTIAYAGGKPNSAGKAQTKTASTQTHNRMQNRAEERQVAFANNRRQQARSCARGAQPSPAGLNGVTRVRRKVWVRVRLPTHES